MKKPVLLNAIVGDICGVPYEPRRYRIKEIPKSLINIHGHPSDDTVHTLAIAEALMTDKDFSKSLKWWSRMYPNAGYGAKMRKWINSNSSDPYNSFGNGSAMRVSPCGYMTMNLELAENSASATHNHPEGIKGAKCISDEIGSILFMKDKLKTPSEIELKNLISEILVKYYPDYDLGVSLDERRSTYKFDSTCQGSIPQSIQCVLESNSYEETIGLAISMGGDSDTMAAISGSIAGCMWEIPDNLVDFAYKRLDRRMIKVIEDFDKFIGR